MIGVSRVERVAHYENSFTVSGAVTVTYRVSPGQDYGEGAEGDLCFLTLDLGGGAEERRQECAARNAAADAAAVVIDGEVMAEFESPDDLTVELCTGRAGLVELAEVAARARDAMPSPEGPAPCGHVPAGERDVCTFPASTEVFHGGRGLLLCGPHAWPLARHLMEHGESFSWRPIGGAL